MLFKLITVGKIKDRNLAALCAEMLRRVCFDAKVDLQEIRDGGKESENRRILEMLAGEQGYVVALSEDGGAMDSVALAARLESIHRRVVFVVGGPLGLDEAVKSRADLVLALSSMTFTHEMARYILLEQIFRAITIIKGRGYHNA